MGYFQYKLWFICEYKSRDSDIKLLLIVQSILTVKVAYHWHEQ